MPQRQPPQPLRRRMPHIEPSKFGDVALEVAMEEEPPARSDQMDAAAKTAVGPAPRAPAGGNL